MKASTFLEEGHEITDTFKIESLTQKNRPRSPKEETSKKFKFVTSLGKWKRRGGKQLNHQSQNFFFNEGKLNFYSRRNQIFHFYRKNQDWSSRTRDSLSELGRPMNTLQSLLIIFIFNGEVTIKTFSLNFVVRVEKQNISRIKIYYNDIREK